MYSPEPDFKICQGTVPANKLYDKSKAHPGDMNSFDPLIMPSDKCTGDKEYNPEEMKENDDVCSN